MSSMFEDFYSQINLLSLTQNKFVALNKPLVMITESLWDIETVLYRIDWLNNGVLNKNLDNNWYLFSKSDIRLFHIELRSLLDHLGLFIKNLVPSKNKPKDSFHALRSNVEKYFKLNIIDQKIYLIINSASWFDDFSVIRDKIVHNGATISTFFQYPGDPIMFSIGKYYFDSLVFDKDFIIGKNNLLNFERYAAFYMAHIYNLLDEIIKWAYQVTNLKFDNSMECRRSHPGIQTVYNWLVDLENYLSDKK